MSQSLSQIYVHLVFSTKERRNLIPPELLGEMHAYLAGECQRAGSFVLKVGGMPDHVHVACTLPRTVAPAELAEEIKKSSSAWIKRRDPRCAGFAWQGGYSMFSVSQSQVETLKRYIANQAEHHKKRSFKDELLEILRLYHVEFDEAHLWT